MSKLAFLNYFQPAVQRSGEYDNRYSVPQAYQWIDAGLKMINRKQSIIKEAEVDLVSTADKVLFPNDYVFASNAMLSAVQFNESRTFFRNNSLFFPYRIPGGSPRTDVFYLSAPQIRGNTTAPRVRSAQLYGVDRSYLGLDRTISADSSEFLQYKALNQVENARIELTFVENYEADQEINIDINGTDTTYIAKVAPDPDEAEFKIGSSALATAINFFNRFNLDTATHKLTAMQRGQIVSISATEEYADTIITSDNADLIISSYDAVDTLNADNRDRVYKHVEACYFDYLSTATDVKLATDAKLDLEMRKMFAAKAIRFYDDARKGLTF